MINLNMLICANSANSGATRPDIGTKKPYIDFIDPFETPKAQVKQVPDNKMPNPFEDKPIKVAGRNYQSVDAFLATLKVYKNTHTEDLTSEMKRELVELFERAHKKGIRFRISCAFVSQKENEDRIKRSEAMGHKGMVAVNSLHLDGRAVDLRASNSDMQKLIVIWRDEMKHRSGADFPKGKYEPWHFDLGPDPEWKKLSKGQKNKTINEKA